MPHDPADRCQQAFDPQTFTLPPIPFHDKSLPGSLICDDRIPAEFCRSSFTGQTPGRPAGSPDDQEVVAMSLLISGIVSVILGVIGFSLWWSDFVTILKGGVPIMLMLGGILAVYVGLDAMQDRIKEERQKQEEKLDKTREEIEQVKAQAEQYREEIEKLKEQARKNTA
jgi:hypothetical protein